MKGRSPTKEEKDHMQKVAALGCIICELYLDTSTPAMLHHVEGRTKKGCHIKVLPLCFEHHQGGNRCDKYVSRHPYKAEFERRYGTEAELLEIVNEKLKG